MQRPYVQRCAAAFIFSIYFKPVLYTCTPGGFKNSYFKILKKVYLHVHIYNVIYNYNLCFQTCVCRRKGRPSAGTTFIYTCSQPYTDTVHNIYGKYLKISYSNLRTIKATGNLAQDVSYTVDFMPLLQS